MSHDGSNRDLMVRLVEAFGSGDNATVQELIAEDAVWHVPGRSSVAGTYSGHAAIFGFFGKVMAISGGTFHTDHQDTLASETHGMSWDRATAQREGASLSTPIALLTRIQEGRLVEAWDLVFDQPAWDAFFE